MASSSAPAIGKKARHPCVSALEQAFQHCPSVLFAFLADNDAANIACASSSLSNICKRRYDIKCDLPICPVLAGLYPCVVRRVRFGANDNVGLVSMLPSTVNSLEVDDEEGRGRLVSSWRVSDLPRSLIHFSLKNRFDRHAAFIANISSSEDWPPGLTSLQLHVRGLVPPLPSTLRVFGSNSLQIAASSLPDSLTTLRIPMAKTDEEIWSQLPSHLTTLDMMLSSQTTTKHLAHLPASLTHLTIRAHHKSLHSSFQADGNGCVHLPAGLRYLRTQDVPYRAFADLPLSLEHLFATTRKKIPRPIEFWGFDEPIGHASLQTLKLPRHYDHSVDANLLPSLRTLSLNPGCNQSLDDLPGTLTDLTLIFNGPAYARSLDRLPSSLKRLALHHAKLMHPLHSLPPNLTELDLISARERINYPVDPLPRHLLSFVASPDFVESLDALPSSLTRLYLSTAYLFNSPINRLPESLQVLILPWNWKQPVHHLPSSLMVLKFLPKCLYNHALPSLPDSLSTLHLGWKFNQPLPRLPRGLTELKLGYDFNHPLPLTMPALSDAIDAKESLNVPMAYPVALRSLELGRCFNQPLSLPPSLTKLAMDVDGVFDQPLPISSLPSKLTMLWLPKEFLRRHPEFNDEDAIRRQSPFLHVCASSNKFAPVLVSRQDEYMY